MSKFCLALSTVMHNWIAEQAKAQGVSKTLIIKQAVVAYAVHLRSGGAPVVQPAVAKVVKADPPAVSFQKCHHDSFEYADLLRQARIARRGT